VQLALQAADVFRESKGFGVRGGHIGGKILNFTLKKPEMKKKVI